MDFEAFFSPEALIDLERIVAFLREIVFRSYRIIYRLNSEIHRVKVVRFWHGSRGFPQIPRRRMPE